jgi:hypothetical protein
MEKTLRVSSIRQLGGFVVSFWTHHKGARAQRFMPKAFLRGEEPSFNQKNP